MTHWDYSMDIIVHGNLSGKKIQFNVWSCMVIFVATMIMNQWMEWISDSWNIAMFDKKLRGEDALWCSSEILTCEWSIPGYLDACSIKYLLIINWPSIEWRCHRSRFTEGDIVILLLYVIVVCLMCVPCGNSLIILGNLYVRGSASWGVIEEDLSGASSARVRFSVGIAAAHVRFFEASYVRRSDVFSCKTLSLGK